MVSVIVPIFNSAPYLDECVRSILAQTHRDVEAILVDDGSTDDSLAICRRFASEDPRVKVIARANGGVSAARNSGLAAASGEWVAFVDGDDALHPRFVERMMAIAESGNADIACSAFHYGLAPKWSADASRIASLSGAEALEDMLYQRRINSSVSTKLFRRSFFDGIEFAEGKRYEDLEILPRIFMRAPKICFAAETRYFYRARSGSFISRFTPERLDVLGVTASIERFIGSLADGVERQRLLSAARDRRFAANFNMFALCAIASHPKADECWAYLKGAWRGVAQDPKSRIKNRLGAALVPLGRKICERASKIMYS